MCIRDRRYAAYMAAEAEAYFAGWGEEGEVDLLASMNELTTFIASRCLIGHEFRQNLTGEFAKLYRDLEGGINLIAFFKPYWPLPKMRRRDRARLGVVELISGVMRQRRATTQEHEDFLQTLMDARYKDGRPLSEAEITGILLALIFAGQHTSTVLSTWTGVLLLQHRDYLPALLDEQRQVFGAGQAVSLEALRQLQALERCIREAERMHPPLIMLMRKVLRDLQYGDYVIPAGDLVMVSPAVSHRLPEVFAKPNRYDPDRFGPGREEDKQSPYALITFGGGKHRCVGATFAYQQIKIIWSVLLRNFELELVDRQHQPDYSTFVVGPKPPCRVRYRRRAIFPSPAAAGEGRGEGRLVGAGS